MDISECRSLKRQYYDVIILDQHIFLQIWCFMLGPNILKWIIILFMKELLKSCLTLGLYLQEIRRLMDLQSHYPLDN
jgi:hypothetical protein